MTKKHPGGRPTKYDPAFCDEVIELGKQGKSQVQIACALDVDPATLRNWTEAHPEFLLALTRAKAHEQDWWETKGQEAVDKGEMSGPGATVWKKSMEARFRNDYTERKEVEHSGAIAIDERLERARERVTSSE